ncbi:MAG: LysR family transcriptional regulator [Actinomycetales bacterium]
MSTSITIQQLQYFLSAVEHGSLSAAAEANYIAQPSLSEQIRRLESQLGVTLFTRTNRRLILTEAARVLIPHAERTVEAAEAAAAAVDPVRTLTGGTVAFGTFGTAHHLLHTEVASRFRALHPNVRLRLVGLNSVQVADGVREGELEAGLVALPVDDRGLWVSPVQWVAEAVYFSRDAERVREPVAIEQLAEAELVLPEVRWGDMDPTRRQLVARAQIAGASISPMVEVESPAAALALAARGVGDTIISLPLAHAVGVTDSLQWASLEPPLFETFAFITLRHAHLSPATRVLIDLICDELSRIPHSAPLNAR